VDVLGDDGAVVDGVLLARVIIFPLFGGSPGLGLGGDDVRSCPGGRSPCATMAFRCPGRRSSLL
jgi:hypothetical protein